MILFNAFTAENGVVIWAVEVLNPLVMYVTKEAVNTVFVLKVDISKDRISLHDLV